jgi:zona occludens toxin
LGGRYIEAFHMAEDTGKYEKDFLSVSSPKKIPSFVWRLYDSTTTGAITDTKAGLSLFKNPRLIMFVCVLAGAVAFVFRNGSLANPLPGRSGGAVPAASPVEKPSSPVREDSGIPADTRGAAATDHVRLGASDPVPVSGIAGPFSGLDVYILVGYKQESGAYQYMFSVDGIEVSSSELLDRDYRIISYGFCFADIIYKQVRSVIRCRADDVSEGGAILSGFVKK